MVQTLQSSPPRTDAGVERLDANRDPHIPGDRSQQGPPHLHAGSDARLLVSVPDGLRALLLHVEDRRHEPRAILEGDVQVELSDCGPLSDDEPALPVLQLRAPGLVLVYSGKSLVDITMSFSCCRTISDFLTAKLRVNCFTMTKLNI